MAVIINCCSVTISLAAPLLHINIKLEVKALLSSHLLQQKTKKTKQQQQFKKIHKGSLVYISVRHSSSIKGSLIHLQQIEISVSLFSSKYDLLSIQKQNLFYTHTNKQTHTHTHAHMFTYTQTDRSIKFLNDIYEAQFISRTRSILTHFNTRAP